MGQSRSLSLPLLPATEIRQIAPLLGSGWRMVGRELGLHEAELENIRADHRESQLEQGYQMLRTWGERHGTVSAQSDIASLRRILNRSLENQGIK